MKAEKDYIQDITAMRSMMERSSKFMSLSGLASIFAGAYALIGAFIAFKFFEFTPQAASSMPDSDLLKFFLFAVVILLLAVGTAVYLSYKKSVKRGEKIWNTTSRRVVFNMSVPLVAGGVLLLILISKQMFGLVAPLSLIFYGIALYNISGFTYTEVKSLGLIIITLGLLGVYFLEYGLFFWAAGFGLVHIIYGIYIHYRYER